MQKCFNSSFVVIVCVRIKKYGVCEESSPTDTNCGRDICRGEWHESVHDVCSELLFDTTARDCFSYAGISLNDCQTPERILLTDISSIHRTDSCPM